jgi:hypothetical protein
MRGLIRFPGDKFVLDSTGTLVTEHSDLRDQLQLGDWPSAFETECDGQRVQFVYCRQDRHGEELAGVRYREYLAPEHTARQALIIND